ncbi:MAG: RluA family pseudouridine synthase [Polyangiales bacterium]
MIEEDLDFVAEQPGRLDALIRGKLGGSWNDARKLVERGKVTVDGERITDSARSIRRDARIEIRPRARRIDEGMLDDQAIVFHDPHLVVVRKPAGISTIPYEAGERGTLEEKTRLWLVRRAKHPAHASLGVVHRIDKETTGLVVFARTLAAKKILAQAFRVHAIERRYVAIVHGSITAKRTFETFIVEDRGDGLRGSAKDSRLGERIGQRAITHAAPIELLGPASLIACALETGRTHQIRIHLSESGHPLVGDRVYTRDRLKQGLQLLQAPRLMLHAAILGFEHPISKKPLRFTEPVPKDILDVASKLAGRAITVDVESLPL